MKNNSSVISSDRRGMDQGRKSLRIVVIGGSGLIGSKLVAALSEHGHEAIAASPNSGVNTLTGEGLDEALRGASVAVDVLSVKLVRGAELKVYPGLPHGMCSTHKDRINTDLLSFLKQGA